MIRLTTNQSSDSTDIVPMGDPMELALKESQVASQGAPRQNVLRVLHQLLRGRYHWIILLGLLLGGGGAYLGYHHGAQFYTSTGSIRVNYVLRRVLYNDEDTGAMPGYDAFIDAQMSELVSRKVIGVAITEPKWAALRPVPNDANMFDLTSRLKVTQKNDQIVVESSDKDPVVATAAVNAVIEAYRTVYKQDELDDDVVKQLNDKKDALTTQAKAVREQIETIAKPYGSEKLDGEYAARLSEVTGVEADMEKMENDIAVDSTEQGAAPLSDMSDEALGFIDKPLGDLYGHLRDEQLNETIIKAKNNGTPPTGNQDWIQCEASIKAYQDAVKARVTLLRRVTASGVNLPGMPEVHGQNEITGLVAKHAALSKRRDLLRKELVSIGQQNIDLSNLHKQEDDLTAKLTEINSRLDELQTEKPMERRIEILSEGDLPIIPDKDTRPKLAAAGGVGGLFFATLAVMGVGLASGRMRAPQDLQLRMSDRSVLGIIPRLDDGPDFAKRAAVAAECVHRSRTMLEIWGRANKRMILGVTSPSHGSGNTSVAMSLGVSFATAGLRTLMIDCDFVTTGLSPRLQTVVRRDLASVLKRTGLVSEAQINHAMRVAGQDPGAGTNGRRMLGETCVELGYLTKAELDAAMSLQANESVGILDALAGEPLQSCVGKTGIKNLSILPRGVATPAHAAKIGSAALRQLLETARQHYDTVIVDTSAMLSGLEASIVASSVDGMVVTVARGEQKSRFSATLSRLKELNCPVAGIIFNQALPSDVPPGAPSDHGPDEHGIISEEETRRGSVDLEPHGRLATLGPLARSIVAGVATADEGAELGE